MYLSQLVLNPRDRNVRRDLTDCHDLHRTLLRVFPQTESATPRDEFGLLYRVETNARSGTIAVIVQSQVLPDWARLPDKYLLEAENNPACKPIGALHGALSAGRQLVFRLRANPTRKVGTRRKGAEGGKSNGQRVEIRGEEEQIAWLERKAAAAGFRLLRIRVGADQMLAAMRLCGVTPNSPSHDVSVDLPNLRARPADKVFGWRADKNSGRGVKRLTFGAVQFEGLLEITDVEKFKHTLADGIGSGKAYGFGLLSIAPAR